MKGKETRPENSKGLQKITLSFGTVTNFRMITTVRLLASKELH
jgi:hypothetical protein